MAAEHTGGRQAYRIAYEAFSQFSAKLNKARSLQDIERCLTRNLKYLIGFRYLRVCFGYGERWILSITEPGKGQIEDTTIAALLSFEEALLDRGLPFTLAGAELATAAQALEIDPEELHELWGWSFDDSPNRRVLLSLAPGPGYQLSHKDVTIIRLLADALEAKLLEICLFDEVAQKNRRIESILQDQAAIIHHQTADLEDKNRKLLEILSINAHNMREPLTRIMGLLGLLHSDASMAEELMPMLEVSAQDLDTTLQKVIQLADTEVNKATAASE
ncbi:MAG: hypothetical protein E1N59_2790 [Puniceicoccaceae bacterium 5H]|nr:MAG: hypothetical protein E1N59_2790 [Puniceicoccaceae bacterium 5H]